MSTSLMDVVKEDGVRDLPLKARGKFAHALIEERLGNADAAMAYLDEAITAETQRSE